MNGSSSHRKLREGTKTRWVILGAAMAGVVLATGLALSMGAKAGAAREGLYDPDADGRAQLAKALEQAKAEDKRVLVQWGANWCGWCHKLHDYFRENAEARQILEASYVVVLIDSDQNKPLMKDLDVTPRGVPYLTILGSDGKKIVDQDTGSLETGSAHDPAKVNPFLKRWRGSAEKKIAANSGIAGNTAAEKLESARAIAGKADKHVFVAMGTEWCGWCKRLDELLANETVAPLMRKNYVLLELDQEKTEGAERFREMSAATESRGVPWYAVVDPEGKVLATSDKDGKNTGYPVRDDEIETFMAVIATTAKHLDAGELAAMEKEIRAIGRKLAG